MALLTSFEESTADAVIGTICVYDPKRYLSDVVILDAQDFAGDPIATIRLPVRVPFGFRGGWAPDKLTVIE